MPAKAKAAPQDDELRDLVKGLYEKINGLELRIKRLELQHKDVPADVMTVIAAAVAAYLGEKPVRRQPRYAAHNPQHTRR